MKKGLILLELFLLILVIYISTSLLDLLPDDEIVGYVLEDEIAANNQSHNDTYDKKKYCTYGDGGEVKKKNVKRKSKAVAFFLAFFLGDFGVMRCYLGYTCLGAVKCIFCGGCGVWTLLDWIFILCGVLKRSSNGCAMRNDLMT